MLTLKLLGNQYHSCFMHKMNWWNIYKNLFSFTPLHSIDGGWWIIFFVRFFYNGGVFALFSSLFAWFSSSINEFYQLTASGACDWTMFAFSPHNVVQTHFSLRFIFNIIQSVWHAAVKKPLIHFRHSSVCFLFRASANWRKSHTEPTRTNSRVVKKTRGIHPFEKKFDIFLFIIVNR